MMNCCAGIAGTILALAEVIPSLAFGIASYVIGFQNYGEDNPCTDNALIPLPTWLIAFGTVEFFSILMALVFTLSAFCGKKGGVVAMVMMVLYSIPRLFWLIAWSIVGAYALFHDSMTCKDSHDPDIKNIGLWAMTLASLIWMWIALFRVCCVGSTKKE